MTALIAQLSRQSYVILMYDTQCACLKVHISHYARGFKDIQQMDKSLMSSMVVY